ncbi:MAG: YebC/PmpR family DNA-binding transcriptional regulator [Gammaproteobacteria bacterium]|nr:YebC/PmpR family DNA-binding transcriptional regulator [Gammaproteobacteria bacterium]MDH3406004.1 YebC/PmpR family DNA-binding transcriptional regulator [Gammaproteobacteria bacterium]MDH3561911.1 YebC/PmpR family DNA-binding transcriptional regulator [Gammaproteobacteria bacterium]MDH5486375.1 YebC/PmpR family DNA-binding transcriptional regulator [Gammaproteobacteria bacterium]
MAGHSKWANIKHRKGVQDARRGKIFTKLIREITVAARSGGGGDPKLNPRLRTAMDKALAANMTKETIERAILRGTGELEGAQYEEVHYEGYGPAGVAIMVEGTTDNRTRTVGEVRHAFSKHGGNLGQDGSVAFLFNKTGILSYPVGTSEDKIMEAALEAGADDVIADPDGSIEVLTAPETFHAVVEAMEKQSLKPEHAEIQQRAATTAPVMGEDAEKMLKLLEALEDLDDVQNVYSNADFPDELLKRAS